MQTGNLFFGMVHAERVGRGGLTKIRLKEFVEIAEKREEPFSAIYARFRIQFS